MPERDRSIDHGPDDDLAPEGARYDALADGYARHWGPVIRPAAIALLDRLPAAALGSARHAIDVGTGTGALAIEALIRWPSLRVTGVDPSPAMLALAEADRVDGRFVPTTAFADDLPFDDGTFDAAISSFVLQLVPNRGAALREIRRVLRPGAAFGWVTWLVGGEGFHADEVVDRVLDEFGFDPPERDGRSGDLASPEAAAASTRRAGFGSVHATAGELVHRWTPEAYAGFVTEFDEQSTFDELPPDERAEAEARLLEELGRLRADEMTVRMPVVYVTGIARRRA